MTGFGFVLIRQYKKVKIFHDFHKYNANILWAIKLS